MSDDALNGEDLLEQYEPVSSDDGASRRMSYTEFLDWALENPDAAALGTPEEYLYRAIMSKGTRTIIEQGEEKERPRVFDDPYNDGEHAVFGNTDVLNDFLKFLKKTAKKPKAKAPFLIGPTATGKSEFLWNLEETLKQFSRTDEGRLYTLGIPADADKSDMPEGSWRIFANHQHAADSELVTSPTRINPLSLLKELDRDSRFEGEKGAEIEELLNERRKGEESALRVEAPDRIDPQTKYYLDALEEMDYDIGEDGRDTLIEFIEDIVRVERVELDRGEGLGTLNSGDDYNRFNDDMIGSYPMMEEPIPPNFQYTGALCLGSPAMFRLDDSDQYWHYLEKMNEILDRGEAELPTGEPLPVETVPVFVANPDFAKKMAQQQGLPVQPDPDDPTSKRMEKTFKVLSNSTERRMKFFKQGYLTNYGYESELIRKMLDEDWNLTRLYETENPEDMLDIIRRPMAYEDEGSTYEFAPHAVEAAALAEVVTRLDADARPGKNPEKDSYGRGNNVSFPGGQLGMIEKAELWLKGFVEREKDGKSIRLEKYDFDFDEGHKEYGFDGIPVTQTVEVFEDLADEEIDWDQTQEGIDVSYVRTAYHVLDKLEEYAPDIREVPEEHRDAFPSLIEEVEEEITDRYNEDVLNAALEKDAFPAKDTVNTYIEKLFCFKDDEPYVTDRNTEREVKPEELRETEIQFFNFDEDQYSGAHPAHKEVVDFREGNMTEVTRKLREYSDENDMSMDEFLDRYDMRTELEKMQERVGNFSWDGVEATLSEDETFKPNEWSDKELEYTDPTDLPTEDELEDIKDTTKRLKNKVIRNMVAEQDYSIPSAYMVAREVVDRRA